MTTKHLHILFLLALSCLQMSGLAQKRDISNGQYSTPEEKEFYRLAFKFAKDLVPRQLGKWKVHKEDEDNSHHLITLGHPVNKGVYAVNYTVKYFDLTNEEYRKAYDSISNIEKARPQDAPYEDILSPFLAQHLCTIQIYFNTTQLPFHFVKGAIEVVQPHAPFTYLLRSTNAGKEPLNKYAIEFGMGPHKKPTTYYYDPSSPKKDGYTIASSILNQKAHPFSIQTIDIIIEGPQSGVEEFLKAIDTAALSQILGKPLVKIP